jgi:hypothetical protein
MSKQPDTPAHKRSLTETLSEKEPVEEVEVPAKPRWEAQEKIEILDKFKDLRYYDMQTGFLGEVSVEAGAEYLYVPVQDLKRWIKNEDKIRAAASKPKQETA